MSNMNKDQPERQRSTGLFFGISIAVVFILIGAAIKALFYTPYPVILVEFAQKKCFIEQGFDLKWQHSVEKQWWIESYEIEDEQLLLTDAYLQTFGAGTPSTETLSTTSQKYPNYVHYRMNLRLPHLNWMISPSIKAQIITKKHHLPIYQWVEGYTNIYISANTQNFWNILRQDSCNEYSPP